MSESNKMFLRRLEEMWDKEKLYNFVSEQVNWMYEDLQSPDEIKGSFLNTFHDELVSIANVLADPLDTYQKVLERAIHPTLIIKGPVDPETLQNGLATPGRIMRLSEGCEVEWVEKDALEAIMNTPEYKEAMKEIEKEIFNNARIEFERRNQAPGREDGPGTC